MKNCLCFIAILVTLLSVCTVNATIYYVDKNGDDYLGTGASTRPWKTIAHALSTAGSGDVIEVNDGVYNEGQLNVPEGVSFTSTSKDPSRVIIQPKKNLGLSPFVNLLSPNPGSNGNQAVSYLSFNGHSGTYRALVGIKVMNRNNVKITHCNITDFTGSNGAYGVVVRSNEISYTSEWWLYWPDDPQAPGIETNIDALWPANPVENFELSYCTITNCGYKESISGSGLRYPAIKPYHIKNSTIHHNTINTEDSFAQPIKSVCAFLDNVDIYNNDIVMALYIGRTGDQVMPSFAIETWVHRRGCEIYNNKSNGMFSITVGKETKIHDNEIIANWPPETDGNGPAVEFILQSEGEVYNNYIENAGSRGIISGLALNSGSSNRIVRNVSIHNNIIYNSKMHAIEVSNQNKKAGNYLVENIEIFNNICDDLRWPQTYRGLIFINPKNDGSGSVTTNNIKIKNNIMVNSPGYAGKTIGRVTNLVIDNNLFWKNYRNSWYGSTPTNTIVKDPKFLATGDRQLSYYELQNDSPMWYAFGNPAPPNEIQAPTNVRVENLQ